MSRGKAREGLTLVEVLIATSVIAFAALGVASMFPAAFNSVLAGGQVTKATMLAQAMIDMIKSEPFDVLQSRYDGLNTAALTGMTCPAELHAFSSPDDYRQNFNKMKWWCDLQPSAAQDVGQSLPLGQGLPAGYGAVSVECVDASGATGACSATDVRRVTVTVFWGLNGSRSVGLVANVARRY
jgi:Tfp pilus assembly protein PilV